MSGKGSKDTRTPDYEKRREGWDRIFGKPKEEELPESDSTLNEDVADTIERVDQNEALRKAVFAANGMKS